MNRKTPAINLLSSASLLLCLAMLLPLISSCAAKSNGDASSDLKTTTAPLSVSTSQNAETEIPDGVPKDLNFNNAAFNILVREQMAYEFEAEATTGETVNDAVYARNMAVEERLGIKFNYIKKPDSNLNSEYKTYNTAITNSINAGSDEYQLVSNYSYYGVSLANQGMYLNLCDLELVDLEKPWWSQDFVNEMTLRGQLYFLVGDMTTTATERLMATYMNQTYAKDYFPDIDMYKVVNDGDFTMDYLLALVKPIYKDLNANNTRDVNDFYGAGAGLNSMPIDGLMAAFGITVTEKDENGDPKMVLNNDHTLKAIDMLYKFYFESDGVVYGTKANNTYYGTIASHYMGDKFSNGELVFNFAMLQDAANVLRNLESDYAIFPLPKLDENQEEYRTTAQDMYSIISIPKTVVNTDMSAATLELLGAESYRKVRPAYFETAFKTKYLRDEKSAQMFDLIVDGAVYNFGVVYSNSISNPVHIVRNLIVAKSKDFASKYKTYEKAIDVYLSTLIKNYESME